MRAELEEGAVDGTFKKTPMNTSNLHDRPYEREQLPWYYGVEDAPLPFDPTTNRPARKNPGDHI